MARQKFVHFVPRDKPPKLGKHKKNKQDIKVVEDED